MYSKNSKARSVFFLVGEINEEKSERVCQWLIETDAAYQRDSSVVAELVIQSCGGELASGFAIIDAMKLLVSVPVHTYGIGELSSAAFMIFIAGDKRILSDNCLIISHAGSYTSDGRINQQISTLRSMDFYYERQLLHYIYCQADVRATGNATRSIEYDELIRKEYVNEDRHLTPMECLEKGWCDEVVSSHPWIKIDDGIIGESDYEDNST